MPREAKDLTGEKYGRLIVVECTGRNKHGRPLWLCECECNNKIIVSSPRLLSGNTKSCGCLREEAIAQRNTKHGLKEARLYEVWKNMKKRCYNPQTPNYKHYGGRGISVCDEWRHNFQAFFDWAMENGYDETAPRGETTIDRIDVNGNYEPDNCRWITIAEQQRNKRTNKSKKHGGDVNVSFVQRYRIDA